MWEWHIIDRIREGVYDRPNEEGSIIGRMWEGPN